MDKYINIFPFFLETYNYFIYVLFLNVEFLLLYKHYVTIIFANMAESLDEGIARSVK